MSSMQDLVSARRPAWLTFAAIVLFSVGILRIISALYYFADSARINSGVRFGAFEDQLWLWGLWDLLIGGIAIAAAYSLLSGNEFGRLIAYVWAIAIIVQSFMIMTFAPWFATASLVLAGLVIYGLAVTENWRETTPTGGRSAAVP